MALSKQPPGGTLPSSAQKGYYSPIRLIRKIQNLTSISPRHYDLRCLFVILAPKGTSSPPFPHLERVMVLGLEAGSEEVTGRKKNLGVPLKTLVLGRGANRDKDGR